VLPPITKEQTLVAIATADKMRRDGLSYELSGLDAGFKMTCPQYPSPVYDSLPTWDLSYLTIFSHP
jgi:hypothetical protein